MEIKILGAGCTTCKGVCSDFEIIAKELNVDATVEKVLDPEKIAEYGEIKLPAIIINNKVKSSGKVPNKEEIFKLIEEEK